MKASGSVLAPVLACLAASACTGEGGEPVEPAVDIAPVVSGTVFGGSGRATGGQFLTVALLPSGCAGPALAQDSLEVAETGRFSVAFPRRSYPSLVCVRAVADAWRGRSDDDNVVARDSVRPGDSILLDIHYDWARARVSVYSEDTTTVHPAAFSFVVSDGRDTAAIPGAELARSPIVPGYWQTGPLDVASAGTLRVRVSYAFSGTAGGGIAEFPLSPDALIGATARIAATDPTRACFGCAGSAAFPLHHDGALAPDSLYLVFARLPASHEVIF